MTTDRSRLPSGGSNPSRRGDQRRTEQGRTEQGRTEPGRTEPGRGEQSRGGQSRRDQGRGGRPYRPRRRFDGSRGPSADRRRGPDPARRAAIEAFDPATSGFVELGVPERVVRILGVDGIVEPTAVQAAVVPDAMGRRDVLGRARTGSGKTLAFGLPILARLAGATSRANHPRALIVVPTRELAGQVASALEPLADALELRMVTIYGGAPYDRQIRRLDRGADVVVATPGRLDDLVRRGACNLDAVEVVALDEADHLCDLGFFPVVNDLLGRTPEGGQRLLLSATLDGDVDKLVRRHLSDPARHEIDPDAASVTTMNHHILVVSRHDKLAVTTELVRSNPRSIVFTRTKGMATDLADDLSKAGVAAVDLHGDLSQRVRERNLSRFRSGTAKVVVATDVAARGIHVDDVGMVVHFDPAGEPKGYLHRSGRTARAGASGSVVTMATFNQAGQLGDVLRRAGVEAKNVDSRSVDRPLTAASLDDAPAMTLPAPARPGSSARGRGGPRRSPRHGSAHQGGYRRGGAARGGRRSAS